MEYTQHELLQMTPYEIKPQFTKKQFCTVIEPLLTGEQDSLHFETLHRHKQGYDFPVEIFLPLVKEESGTSKYHATSR